MPESVDGAKKGGVNSVYKPLPIGSGLYLRFDVHSFCFCFFFLLVELLLVETNILWLLFLVVVVVVVVVVVTSFSPFKTKRFGFPPNTTVPFASDRRQVNVCAFRRSCRLAS